MIATIKYGDKIQLLVSQEVINGDREELLWAVARMTQIKHVHIFNVDTFQSSWIDLPC